MQLQKMFFFGILVISTYTLNSMEVNTKISARDSHFTKFDHRIIGTIIVHLTKSIAASKQPQHDTEKIPAIVWNIKALSLTNPKLYETINSTETTLVFSKALDTQFHFGLWQRINNRIQHIPHRIQVLDTFIKQAIAGYLKRNKFLEDSNFF